MGSKKVKIPVADYRMSIHYGICKGQVDSINQIYVKDKVIWCGRINARQDVDVSLPKIFGGDKKEGGVDGVVEAYVGSGNQLLSAAAASRLGGTPETLPGYRGIASLFFRGRGANGFKWISNNPYLPGAWANVTRLPKSLSSSFASIYEVDPPPDGSILDGVGEKFPITVGGTNSWLTVDLLALGIPAEKIDEGTPPGEEQDPANIEKGVRIYLSFEIAHLITGGVNTTVDTEVEFYGEEVSPEALLQVGFIGQTAFNGTIDFSGLHYDVACSDHVPVGCRFVRIRYSPQNATTMTYFPASEESYFIYGSPGTGVIHCGEDALGRLPDANPAHMLYEALTDRDWGMGSPATMIDVDSFMAAAELFHSERFGLSIAWTKQAEINVYISEILDHVQANLFIDPRTGLWTLVPLRGDYDPDTLPILDPSNCKATNRQRKAFGEIVNEIVVTWTNPNSEKEETVSMQDLAAIASQDGEVVSATRNYYGVRNAQLAMKLCARDLRAASYPIWGCDVVAHRKMSFLRPGSVAKLNWPEDGIEGMIVRVGKVDYGKPGDSAVKFPVTEDVFALDAATYTGTQGSLWETPSVEPTPMPYVLPLTVPLPLLLRSGVLLSEIEDEDYPSVVTAVLADHDVPVEFFELNGPLVRANGDVYVGPYGNLLSTPSGLIGSVWPAEVETIVPEEVIAEIAGPQEPEPGNFIYLSVDGVEETSEIVMLDSLGSSGWVVARGMFDTIPRKWLASTRAFFLGEDVDARDPGTQTVGVTVPYQLLTQTSGGALDLAEAPVVEFTPGERPYLPFRPSNVTFSPTDGTPIVATPEAGPGAVVPLFYLAGDQPTTVDVTWANRNRLSEDTLAMRWEAGSVTPEDGQTTVIRLRDLDSDLVLTEETGLTGTSFSFDVSAITGLGRYAIEVLSARDGFTSLQHVSQPISVIELGYGNAYGLSYSA